MSAQCCGAVGRWLIRARAYSTDWPHDLPSGRCVREQPTERKCNACTRFTLTDRTPKCAGKLSSQLCPTAATLKYKRRQQRIVKLALHFVEYRRQIFPISKMTEAAAAKPAKAKKPAKKAEHPPSGVMVLAAVKALKDKKGSSLPAIKKYIAANYKVKNSNFKH